MEAAKDTPMHKTYATGAKDTSHPQHMYFVYMLERWRSEYGHMALIHQTYVNALQLETYSNRDTIQSTMMNQEQRVSSRQKSPGDFSP